MLPTPSSQPSILLSLASADTDRDTHYYLPVRHTRRIVDRIKRLDRVHHQQQRPTPNKGTWYLPYLSRTRAEQNQRHLHTKVYGAMAAASGFDCGVQPAHSDSLARDA